MPEVMGTDIMEWKRGRLKLFQNLAWQWCRSVLLSKNYWVRWIFGTVRFTKLVLNWSEFRKGKPSIHATSFRKFSMNKKFCLRWLVVTFPNRKLPCDEWKCDIAKIFRKTITRSLVTWVSGNFLEKDILIGISTLCNWVTVNPHWVFIHSSAWFARGDFHERFQPRCGLMLFDRLKENCGQFSFLSWGKL